MLAAAETVQINDANLRRQLELALNKEAGQPISAEELATLTELSALYTEITDLTGLEHCLSLTTLKLSYNAITDLAPLSGLTKIDTLYLNDNQVVDLAPVVKLVNLKTVGLNNNQVQEISTLSELNQPLLVDRDRSADIPS